jgi:hypothetical protein
MYVIAALLIAGWLLGLNFYSTGTSVLIMGAYISVAAAVGIIGQLRNNNNNNEAMD